MEPIDLILVGCGVMGTRHLRGHAVLERARPGSLRLRAVCDPRAEAANRVADEAVQLLGYRPRPCAGVAEALAIEPGIVAADVVTDPRSHPEVVIGLLEAGVHVQVEKPMALTVAAGRPMLDAAARTGKVLAVAENYRRDPMARLVRHAIASGAVGRPHFVSEFHISDGRRVVVTPWRHDWAQGGLALDVGVHYSDMLEYLLGRVAIVSARSIRVRDTRDWTPPPTAADPDPAPRAMPVECDDLYTSTLAFESGVEGVWVMHYGASGGGHWQRVIHGDGGSVSGPPDRTGQPARLQRGAEVLEGEAMVAALPDFRLNDTEALFFGHSPGAYEMPFPEIDRNLIAIETAEFLDAVRDGRQPEVAGMEGLRAVAVVMALLESAHCGAPVRVEDVMSGKVRAFQDRMEGGAA